MKKRLFTAAALLILISFLAVTMDTAVLYAQTGTPDIGTGPDGAYSSKEEVIYANLDASGSVSQIYAVNILNVISAGQINDYGSYSAVKNLTSTGDISSEEDALTMDAQPGRFYYQGTLKDNKLPWITNITYSLNNLPINPSELPGQNGYLSITIDTKADPDVNNAFYDNYLLQVSVTLDTDRCRNISAPGAVLANAGTDKLVTFTVLPGKEGHMTVNADVTDFVMKGISVSAVPYTMNIDLPDTSGYTDDLVLLANAVSDLNDGVISIADGVGELKKGADQLADGSTDFGSGMVEISSRSEDLIAASGQIQAALISVSDMLSGASSGTDLSTLTELPAYLTKLSDGLHKIAGGLTELSGGYSQAYTALDAAIRSIPATEISQSDLQTLMLNNKEDKTVSLLVEYYTAARTVQGTYQMVSPAFEAVNSQMPVISSNITTIGDTLDTIAAQLSSTFEQSDLVDSIRQLSDGISTLSINYKAFHNGLQDYSGGIEKLADAYGSIASGITALAEGTDGLDSGILQLKDGTGELEAQTSSMPNQIDQTMEELMADYDTSDFTPVSFLSDKNTGITSVQFIIKTAAIEKPEAETVTESKEQTASFWERLLALFR